MTPPIPDGQHDRLPPHIRRGLDDQRARMMADDAAAAGPPPPAWRPWLALAVTLLVGLALVGLMALLGQAADGPPHVITHTPTTYGAPPT